MKITGFMHVAQMGNWRSVLEEQIATIKSCGLSSKCENIYLGVLGCEKLDTPKPFSIIYQNKSLDLFEYKTLRKVLEYSKENEGLVWYVHTKGVSKTEDHWDDYKDFYTKEVGVDSLEKLRLHEKQWRKYMEHFVLRKHEDCIKGLEGNDLAGASWRTDVFGGELPYFAGNFWWARTSYVRTLVNPYQFLSKIGKLGRTRWGAEVWVGSGSPSVYSLSDFKHNFYRWGVPVESYLPIHL